MLQIQSVRAGYDRTTVLHGVSVEVPKDGVAAVLGHNGAGKSTLLRTVMGLVPASAGTVLLDGEDITRLAPHRRVARGVAYVPQGQQSFPHLTTAENLQLVADGRRAARRPSPRRWTSSPSCASCPDAGPACSPAASASSSPSPAP